MDQLIKLMDELTTALQARVEAGQKAFALAEEVKTLPKLSVVAPHLHDASSAEAKDVVSQLQLQMEFQTLQHAKEQALDTISAVTTAVAQIRSAVNGYQRMADQRMAELVDDYDSRIQAERMMYAELSQRKQALLLSLSMKAERLQKLVDRPTNDITTVADADTEKHIEKSEEPIEKKTEKITEVGPIGKTESKTQSKAEPKTEPKKKAKSKKKNKSHKR